MAYAQVIQRQADPNAQAIQQAGDSVNDAIQREQALGLTARYYKTMQQNADTEQMKAEWQRKVQFTQALIDIKDNLGNNPQAAAIALKDQMDGLHGGDQMLGMKDLAQIGRDSQQRYDQLTQSQGGSQSNQPDYNQMAQAFSPQGGESTPGQVRTSQSNLMRAQAQQAQAEASQAPSEIGLRQAQAAGVPSEIALRQAQAQQTVPAQALQARQEAARAAAEARVQQLTGNIMQNPQSYMQQMQGGSGGQQPGQGGQPQVQNMANQGPVMSGMSVQAGPMNMQYTNPRAKFLDAMAGNAGTAYADKQFEMAPFKQNLKDLKASLNQAIQEQGGPASNELEAGVKGFGGKFLGEVKPNSAIAGFDDSLNTLANGLTSDINHGRPNTVELNGVKEGMPNRSHSAVTNAILFRRLENMATMPGDKPQDWAQMLNQSKQLGRGDDQVVQSLKGMGWDDQRINAQLRRMHQRDGDL